MVLKRPPKAVPSPGTRALKRQTEARHPAPKRVAKAARGKAVGKMPPFVEPALCRTRGRPRAWSGLDSRGQVRRLPDAAARRARQQHPAFAQGPRLDAPFPGDRRRGRAAAGLHHRRRNRCARRSGRAELRGPAGSALGQEARTSLSSSCSMSYSRRARICAPCPLVDRKSAVASDYGKTSADHRADPICRAF